MTNLNELFTLSSLISLQGAAGAALLVPNVLAYVFEAIEPHKKLISLVVSMFLAILIAIIAGPISGVVDSPLLVQQLVKWTIAVLNGFLIFASAVGINQFFSQGTRLGSNRFFRSWF